MGTLAFVLQILLLLAGLFLMMIILLQRGRGGGLAGAFGGAGGQSAFGTKAGDVFTWITVVTATVWVLLAGIGGCAMRSAATSFESKLPNAIQGETSTTNQEEENRSTGAAANTETGGLTVPPAADKDEVTTPKTNPATETGAAPETPANPPEAPAEKPAEAAKTPDDSAPQTPDPTN